MAKTGDYTGSPRRSGRCRRRSGRRCGAARFTPVSVLPLRFVERQAQLLAAVEEVPECSFGGGDDAAP